MSIKHSLRKGLSGVVYGRLALYVLSFSIFFTLTARRSYSQETNNAETFCNTQQKNTSVPYPSKPQPNNRHLSQSRIKNLAKRNFPKATLSTPVFDKSGNIYLTSRDGKLSAIDPDGNTKWYIHLADKINTDFIISSDNTLYFSSKKTLYAAGPNGILKWIFNADNMIAFPPVLDNQGNVYIVTKKDDFLYAIRPDGKIYWKARINGHISTQPSIATNGGIYITTQDNMLYAINHNGSLRWRRRIFRRQTNQPILTATTGDNISFNSIPQHNGESIYKLQEEATQQPLRISHIKPEEIQTYSQETGKSTTTSFVVSTQKGYPPLMVKFSDTSTGEIVDRFWDFGDGTLTSSERYPIHTYTTAGNYHVRLMIKRSDNTSIIAKQDYITVVNMPQPDSKEILAGIQEKSYTSSSTPTQILNIPGAAKFSGNESLVSITNSKNQ